MTILALIKHKDSYHILADGRCTAGDQVVTDNINKTHTVGKDVIFALCGNASDIINMKRALKAHRNPVKLIKYIHKNMSKDFTNCEALVATKEYGVYTVSIHKVKGHDLDVDVIEWGDHDLPQTSGSGRRVVQALLAQYDNPTPEQVKQSMQTAFKTCNSIGGNISHVSLSTKSEPKKKRK